MKKKFYQWLIKWFVIKLNLYLIWSKIHQKLFQRKRLPMPQLQNLSELMNIVRNSKWTPDTWRELWDAIAHPEHAYWKYKQKQTLGDCDDFAVFAAYYTSQWFHHTKILSIQWLDKNSTFKGHNVCIYIGQNFYNKEKLPEKTPNTKMHAISNGFYWATQFNALEDVVKYFVQDGTLISWFTIEPDLSSINKYYFD